jgi:hypothetical protein
MSAPCKRLPARHAFPVLVQAFLSLQGIGESMPPRLVWFFARPSLAHARTDPHAFLGAYFLEHVLILYELTRTKPMPPGGMVTRWLTPLNLLAPSNFQR